jgi:hypothetical protein
MITVHESRNEILDERNVWRVPEAIYIYVPLVYPVPEEVGNKSRFGVVVRRRAGVKQQVWKKTLPKKSLAVESIRVLYLIRDVIQKRRSHR